MAKICFVLDQFPVLSETFVIKQIEGLMAAHQVDVICNVRQSSPHIDEQSYPLNEILPKTKTRWMFSDFTKKVVGFLPWRVRQWVGVALNAFWDLRLNKYDFVIAHFAPVGESLAQSKRFGFLKTPVLTFYHGYDVGVPLVENGLSVYSGQLQGVDFHATVNRYFSDLLIAKGAEPQRVIVHHMGIEPEEFVFSSHAWEAGPIEILSVCRLVEKKGIEFALRGLAHLRQVRPDIQWRYDVIGDGPLLSALRALADDLGIGDVVRFLGAQSHGTIRQKMQSSHVFLLPSVTAKNGDCEGIPVVLMEAMASGLVTVSSRHSGIPDLIHHGETGFLSEEKDFQGIAQNLAWVADHPDECSGIVKAARHFVEREFNNTILNAQLSAFITSRLSVPDRNSR